MTENSNDLTQANDADSKQESYEFVIQFSGEDLPGLLQTFTKPLSDKNYDITNISLASGGGLQTTFITCRQCNPTNGQGFNRWEDQVALEETLDQTVEEWQKNYFENKDEVPPEKPKITVRSQYVLNDHNTTFLVYLKFESKNGPGQLQEIANKLKDNFTVSQTFYWADEDKQTNPIVYMQCRYIGETGKETDKGLREAAQEFHAESKAGNGDETAMDKPFQALRKAFKKHLKGCASIKDFRIKFDANHTQRSGLVIKE
ncbi:MAG: hypothetical protein GXP26_11015 [Planctomycetes bacterium]|nr:hypothetical protein [Planctomycetota bacterium]